MPPAVFVWLSEHLHELFAVDLIESLQVCENVLILPSVIENRECSRVRIAIASGLTMITYGGVSRTAKIDRKTEEKYKSEGGNE
jgi:hypothetical protein